MKHKHWGSLTKQCGPEYQTNVVGSHGSNGPRGKFVAVGRSKEYETNVAGSHGGSPSSKFIGQTGGHFRHGSKLNHNRSS